MMTREPAPFESITFLEIRGPPELPALWLRYTWCDHARAEARLWALAWTPSGVVAETRARPLSELRRWEPGCYESTAGSLGPGRAVGDVGPIRWDLSLEHQAPAQDLVPAAVGRIGRTYRDLSPDLTATGTVTVNGTTYHLRSARGVMGHLSGRRNRVSSWGWCHAAGLDGHPDATFEGLCARLGTARLALPPLTSVRLRLGDRELAFADLTDLATTRATLGPDGWRFSAGDARGQLQGTVALGPPGTAALVEYRDEADRPVWCRNSPFSSVHLIASWPGEAPVHLRGELTAEIGSRAGSPGRRAAPSRW
jgi:hypothetical protein